VGVLIGVTVAVIVGLLIASFFVRRYREATRPHSGWQRTDEVFNDPSTQRVMRVYLDTDGSRHYVEERRGTRGA
jgi:hypothetical protein